MDKISLYNSRKIRLAADYYKAPSEVMVILVHGFTGDRSEEGRFDYFARLFNQSGYNVLRFDFSGSGESDDEMITIENEMDDFFSVLEYVKSGNYQKIGVLGHSLGGLIAIKCYTKDIKTMVLTAPVTHAVHYDWRRKYTPMQVKELDEKGYLTIYKEKGVRRKLVVDKQIFYDREKINQAELLQHISCPVLIIHGNKDESVPHTDSIAAMNFLPQKSKLEIVEGAVHNYNEHLELFGHLSLNWFTTYLSL